MSMKNQKKQEIENKKKIGAEKGNKISETAARKREEVPKLIEKQIGENNGGSNRRGKMGSSAEDTNRKHIEIYAREISDWENYYSNG